MRLKKKSFIKKKFKKNKKISLPAARIPTGKRYAI